jgi:predicted metal-dependent peptidase
VRSSLNIGLLFVRQNLSAAIRKYEAQLMRESFPVVLNDSREEISAISDEAQPEAIHIVYCDAAVQGVQEFAPSEPVVLEPKGGAGTDFRPVFQWVEDNAIDAVCLIYLTDLCCHSYPNPPEYPVLWVTDSRRTAPFGETVEICVA